MGWTLIGKIRYAPTMIYIGIITPVLIGLAGMYAALQKQDTPRWQKVLLPVFALLTLLTGAYSIYTTYAAKKVLEPWEAMHVSYARVVELWSSVSEANQTKDSAKLEKVLDESSALAKEVFKSRAPSWFKDRVAALGIALSLWAIAERHPWSKPEEVITLYSQERLAGGPFEGRPDKLLAMLGFFRVQDFGPPHKVLKGYRSDGSLQMDESKFSKAFLLGRAGDFFTDLTGMAQ
jgi:hypothetical protein